MGSCTHEDGQILWGKTVYKTSRIRIIQVTHDECGQFGTIVERKATNGEWYEQSEVWHEDSDYYAGKEAKS